MRPSFRFVRLAFALLLALGLSFPLLAFAQEAPPAPAEEAISVRGYVLMGVGSLAGLALTAVLAAGAAAIRARDKENSAWSLLNRILTAAQTAASQVQAEMTPAIKAALADGKITPEEAASLKARGLEVLRLVAGAQLELVPKTLGIAPEAMPTFLSAALERAVTALKGPGKGVTNILNTAPADRGLGTRVPPPGPPDAPPPPPGRRVG